jgi:AcrR family transcriptional regulator
VTARGDRTRARLLEATLAVAGEVGYARASTRAIAERAGVSEGTIYRHFADKTELFFAAALEPSGDLLDWAASLPGRAGTATVEDNLETWMLRLAELEQRVLPLEVAIRADPELARLRRAAMESAIALPGPPGALGEYLAAEQRLGRVAADVDPAQASIVLLAALFGIAFMDEGPSLGSRTDRVRSVVRLLARGMQPGAAGQP